MATEVLSNAYCWINGVDYSSYVREYTINYGSESHDRTTMGQTSRIHKGGLKTWSVDITWNNDRSVVEAALWALVGTSACWEGRAINSCASASNASYSGIVTLTKLPPLSGAVGSFETIKSTFEASSALARVTTTA